MELHQLQCFIAVLEGGGFKRATARLGITQPALSYQIKRLEDELGVQLFHRRPVGIIPTEAARVFVEHAQQVIAAVHEAHQAVRELSDGVTGEILIGTLACLGTYFLPRVLWEIRARHPKVRPKLIYRNSEELFESLLANKLDVAMLPDPPADPRLRRELVFEEPISLVSSPGHPFHGRRSVDAAELKKDVQFVSLSPQTSTGALIRRHLARMGVSIAPVFSADDVETVKMMVEEGMGVAFLPDMVTRDDMGAEGQPGHLCRSALEPPLSLQMVVATLRDSHPPLALAAFIDEVRVAAARGAEDALRHEPRSSKP